MAVPPLTASSTTSSLPAIYRIRIILYLSLIFWSSLVVTFCILRLMYTLSHRNRRSEFHGLPFYESEIVELLISGVIAVAFSPMMFWVLIRRKQRNTISRNWFELTVLASLWALWLGGAAATTDKFSKLPLCIRFEQCRILQADVAWSWLGFTCLTMLLFPAIWAVASTGTWDGHVYEQWTSIRRNQPQNNRPRIADAETGSFYKETSGIGLEPTPWEYRGTRPVVRESAGGVTSSGITSSRVTSSRIGGSSEEACDLHNVDDCRLSSVGSVVQWFGWGSFGSHRSSSRATSQATSRATSLATTHKSRAKRAASLPPRY